MAAWTDNPAWDDPPTGAPVYGDGARHAIAATLGALTARVDPGYPDPAEIERRQRELELRDRHRRAGRRWRR